MFYNYYQVLGVRESASDDEIKKAYRVCAMKWHPDRYSGPDANEKMALINEAYTILRDREARCKYDAELARYRNYTQTARKEDEGNGTGTPQEGAPSSEKERNKPKRDYVFKDKVLEEWIRQARRNSVELARQSLNDLVGMSGVAFKEFFGGVFRSLIFLLILSLVLTLLFL